MEMNSRKRKIVNVVVHFDDGSCRILYNCPKLLSMLHRGKPHIEKHVGFHLVQLGKEEMKIRYWGKQTILSLDLIEETKHEYNIVD
jgi:hypothetical protein